MITRVNILLFTTLLLAAATVRTAGSGPLFPTQGLDARSLGRGGTVIAADGGVSSVFGNPATLRPTGSFSLGVNFLDERSPAEESFVYSIVDTQSITRGAAVYVTDPSFTGLEDPLWGVAFAQSLGQTLIIGESFHTGRFIDRLTSSEEDLSGADLGILLSAGAKLSFGYVARNLYRGEDLLERRDAFGAAVDLPWTLQLTADLEEAATTGEDDETRLGLQLDPFSFLTARFGYQDLADGLDRYTMGVTYWEENGSLDAGVAWDPDTGKVERFILAIMVGM